MNGDPTYWYRRRYDIQNDLTYEGVFIVVLDSCIATNEVIITSYVIRKVRSWKSDHGNIKSIFWTLKKNSECLEGVAWKEHRRDYTPMGS